MKNEMPVATVILQHCTCTRRCFRRPFSCWGALAVALPGVCGSCWHVLIDAQSSEHQRTVKTSQRCNHCVATKDKEWNRGYIWMCIIANHCLKESWHAAEGRRVWMCWEGAHENQGLKNGHAAQRRLHFTSKLFPQPCIDSATITRVHKLLLMEHTKAQHRQETDLC